MIKLSQGGSSDGNGYPSTPIYLSAHQIIAVKPDTDGATKIVTTGHSSSDGPSYSAFIVNESIEDVVAAIDAASSKGAK